MPHRRSNLVLFMLVGGFVHGLMQPAHAQVRRDEQQAKTDTVPLTFADARRLALERNPEFLAEREGREVARGDLRQSRLFSFNPELDLLTSGSSEITGGGSELGLFQEVEWAGQRGLRIRAAEAGLTRVENGVRDAARRTVGEVTAEFYRALAARRRLQVAEEVLALSRQLMRAVRIELAEGEISALEANLAEIEMGRAEARVLAARRELSSTELRLKRLVGIPAEYVIQLDVEVPAPPAPESIDQDSLLRLAIARRPDLIARQAAIGESRELARLARREAIPNLKLGAVAERDESDGESRLRMGVGLPLPLWNRNQGLVAGREAGSRKAELERRALELRIRTEVSDAYAAYIAASEEERVFDANVLRPARANQQLLDIAYREGKLDLTAVLLLRNQLMDAELGYWETWLARREALVDLEAATAALQLQDFGSNNER